MSNLRETPEEFELRMERVLQLQAATLGRSLPGQGSPAPTPSKDKRPQANPARDSSSSTPQAAKKQKASQPPSSTVTPKKSIVIGVSDVEIPVPDAANPACQKLNAVRRFVPHPHISMPRKTKSFGFISPLVYGACLAEQEAKPDLSAGDLADLALQKLGEAARYSERMRDRVVADMGSSSREANRRVENALKEKDEVAKERDELKARVVQSDDEIARLAAKAQAIEKERDELQTKVDELSSRGKRELFELYNVTVVNAIRKGRERYPQFEIDWDDLFKVAPEDVTQAKEAAGRSSPAL